jgi:hypothetical protein
MKAHRHLLKHALDLGHTVSIFDGERWEVKRSSSFNEALACIESVDESTIRIRDNKDEVVGYADICLMNDDHETVFDFSATAFMDQWFEAFDSTIN